MSRRHLRPVGEGERAGDDDDVGSLGAVLDDLEIAHGHVVEATAEAAACRGDVVELVDALYVADAAVTKALQAARKAGQS